MRHVKVGRAWSLLRQSPCAALQCSSVDGAAGLLQVRCFAQPAPAAAAEQEGTTPTAEDEDFRLMQAVLSRVGPLTEMREAHRTNDVQRLRFGDLPATMSLMESFVGSGTSGGYSSTGNPGPQSADAIYDIPAWLEANVPSHDTSPKSPVYHWVTWMEEHLAPDQKRLYLALHEHMRDEPRRQAIMAKAQYELACLWDWQHRRVAAGLPHTWTPPEEEAARRAAIAQAEKEAQALQAAAVSARARAASEASVAAGGLPTLPSPATASSRSSSSAQGSQQQQNVRKAAGSSPATDAAAVAAVPLVREAAAVRARVAEAEAAVADAQRWLIQDPSSSAMLPDMHDALRAAGAAAQRCTDAAHEGDVRALHEAVAQADHAQGIAVRMAAAVAPHWVGSQHADAAAGVTAGTQRGSKSTASSRQARDSSSSSAPTGISMFLKQAEQRKELEEQQRKEAKVKLSQKLGLTSAEQALAQSLNMDLQELVQRAEGNEVAGSSGEAGLQPLLSAFQARIGGGKKQMAVGSNARAVSQMRGAFEQRAREEADKTDALSLLGGDRATTGQPGTRTQNARVPLLGSAGLSAQAKLALQKAREAQQKQAQEQGLPQAVDKDARLSWTQLPVFNHESTMKRMAGMKHDKELVVQGKLLADSQVLDLGSPPPYCPDPLYRTPYQFNLSVRPPTATLDLVLDYLQVKYQDVLLRRDLTRRMCAQLAPPTPSNTPTFTPSTQPPSGTAQQGSSAPNAPQTRQHAPQGSSTSSPSTAAPSPISSSSTPITAQQQGSLHGASTPGHWSGRLSLPEVARVNEQAGQLFEEGRVAEYRSLVRQLAGEGLMTQTELAEHEAAAQLRADELQAGRAAGPSSPADQAAGVSPALQAHLLEGLTGSGTVGFGTSHSLGTLEQARAAWESAWKEGSAGAHAPSGYAAWAAGMSDSAANAASAQALAAAAQRPGSPPSAPPSTSAAGAQQQRQPVSAEAVRSWWAGPGAAAPSFEEARTAWQQYVEMAGNPADAPQLESILLADQELRAARAAAASDPNAQARVASAQANADALNAATARLFHSFVAHTGSATVPFAGTARAASGTGSHATSSSASSSHPQRKEGGAHSDAHDLWRSVSERNAALNPVAESSSSGRGLLSMFKGALTVPDLLRAHWERVGRAFLRTQLAWGTAPGWDQLWSLMTSLHRHLAGSTAPAAATQAAAKRPAAEGQHRPGSSAAPQQPAAPYAAAGLSPASRELLSSKFGSRPAEPQPAAAPQQQPQPRPPASPAGPPASEPGKADSPDASLDPEFLAAVGPAKPPPPEEIAAQAATAALAAEQRQAQQWQQYTEAQEQRANYEASQGAHWPVTPQLAPPYPGARRIVRFQQSIVLGPASALSSTQGLAEKIAAREASDAAHPATFGLGSPPILLPDHPASRRVTMRVNLSDLAQEMGLSRKAVKRMQLVAGPSRYSPATGDLTLVCALHPSREENRRWCLERLHMMAADANAAHPVGANGLRALRSAWD